MKIIVPDGMLKAAIDEFFKAASLNGLKSATDSDRLVFALERALLWLAENPIVPTDEQFRSVVSKSLKGSLDALQSSATMRDFLKDYTIGIQQVMFLAPEPEVPEAIKDLLTSSPTGIEFVDNLSKHETVFSVSDATHNNQILEAYRRGRCSK